MPVNVLSSGGSGVSNLRDTYTTLSPVGVGGYILDTTDDLVVPVDSNAGAITVKLDQSVAVINQRVRIVDVFPDAATNPITITNASDTEIGMIDTNDGAIEFTWTGASWQLSDKVENNFDRDPVTGEITPAIAGDAIVAQKVNIIEGGDGFEVRNGSGDVVAKIDSAGKITARSGEFGLAGQVSDQSVADTDFTNIGVNVDQTVSDEFGNDSSGASGNLLLHMDGADGSTTFADATGNHTATAVGNAQIDTAQSQFGGASGLFDGAGDRVTIPDSPDWDFGSGDFTIDLWYRPASILQDYLLCHGQGSSVAGWSLNANNSTTIRLIAGGIRTFAVPNMNPNVWVHIAMVRSGDNLRCYTNGVESTTGAIDLGASYSIPEFTGDLTIGDITGGGFETDGHIDEVRIVKGSAEWTADFTPPAEQYGVFSTTLNTFDTQLAIGTAGTFVPSSFKAYDETDTLINEAGKVNVAYAVDGGGFTALVDQDTFKALGELAYTSQFDLQLQLVGSQRFSRATISTPDTIIGISSDGKVTIKESGTSVALMQTGGWGYYTDSTYTDGSPLAVASARVKVLNDALGSDTNETFIPLNGMSFWDTATNKIVSAKTGASYDLRLSFKAKASAQNAYFDVEFDIGGAVGVIASQTMISPKTANVETTYVVDLPIFTLGTFVTNGCEIYLNTTDAGVTLNAYEIKLMVKQDYEPV